MKIDPISSCPDCNSTDVHLLINNNDPLVVLECVYCGRKYSDPVSVLEQQGFGHDEAVQEVKRLKMIEPTLDEWKKEPDIYGSHS